MWLVLFSVITILICPIEPQFIVDCDSYQPMDIIFGIDTSGSLGWTGFQTQKNFVRDISLSRLSNETKMGYTTFAEYVNETRPLQFWNESDLSLFIDGLWYSTGWTNTGQFIESSLSQFMEKSGSERQRRLIIITDGNPCLQLVGCPQCLPI